MHDGTFSGSRKRDAFGKVRGEHELHAQRGREPHALARVVVGCGEHEHQAARVTFGIMMRALHGEHGEPAGLHGKTATTIEISAMRANSVLNGLPRPEPALDPARPDPTRARLLPRESGVPENFHTVDARSGVLRAPSGSGMNT